MHFSKPHGKNDLKRSKLAGKTLCSVMGIRGREINGLCHRLPSDAWNLEEGGGNGESLHYISEDGATHRRVAQVPWSHDGRRRRTAKIHHKKRETERDGMRRTRPPPYRG